MAIERKYIAIPINDNQSENTSQVKTKYWEYPYDEEDEDDDDDEFYDLSITDKLRRIGKALLLVGTSIFVVSSLINTTE